MIKHGIKKADEMYRNVDADDIIEKHIVDDVMEEDFFLISEQNNLHQIIEIMKKSDSYHFPIVSREGKFLGITTLGEIRNAFYEEQMDMLVLAGDVVREIDDIVYAGDPLGKAIHMFKTRKVNYIAVLDNKENRKLIGQLEYKKTMDFINKEVLFRQQELELEDENSSIVI
jgi:CBS domain-containing protein